MGLVKIELTEQDLEEMSKDDVIYAEEVFEQASEIYHKGYQAAMPLGVPLLDKHFKRVKGELTIVSGNRWARLGLRLVLLIGYVSILLVRTIL